MAFGLLRTGVGADGFLKATTIMSLEQILKEMEQGRGPLRDPERYFLSIFGTPSNNGRWGWRIEGHHLSLNFTIDGGKIVAATPPFSARIPARFAKVNAKVWPTLGDIEDQSLRLLQSLDDDQKKTAVIAEKAPAEIHSADFKGAGGGLSASIPEETPQGIAYAKLNDHQKGLLQGLIEEYAAEMPPDIAKTWLDDIKKAGVDQLYFAWQGEGDRTKPHAYKVQGPTFLIEFNNTQNGRIISTASGAIASTTSPWLPARRVENVSRPSLDARSSDRDRCGLDRSLDRLANAGGGRLARNTRRRADSRFGTAVGSSPCSCTRSPPCVSSPAPP